MEKKIIEVVAALIWRENQFLICQRPAEKDQGLLWEFVGGKVEPGESKEEALVRECQEELAVTLSVRDEVAEVVHIYPEKTIRLTLLAADIIAGEPQRLEHHDLRWITIDEISQYTFCPADVVLLEKVIAYKNE